MNTRFGILLFFLLATAPYGNMVVGEIMGDPASISDSEGEYLELINTDFTGFAADTLIITVNSQDTLMLAPFSLKPREIFLICRDASLMTAYRAPCDTVWTGLGIANQMDSRVAITYGDVETAYLAPGPLAGVSWENTLDSSRNFAEFTAATQTWIDGDLGSPGTLFSGALIPMRHDLELVSLELDTDASGSASWKGALRNLGMERVSSVVMRITLDVDWDGSRDVNLDSITLPLPQLRSGQSHSFLLGIPPGKSGLFTASLEPDDRPSNNLRQSFYHPSPALALTEVCPNSPEEFPEWIEIKNVSIHDISLKHVEYNGKKVANPAVLPVPSLQPGEFAVLTQDRQRFIQSHGQLKLKLIEVDTWDILKNSGDTVVITAFGSAPLDSMAYASLSTREKGTCLERSQGQAGSWLFTDLPAAGAKGEEASTPGFEPVQDSVFSWRISGKVLDIGKAESRLSITLVSPPNTRYAVKVFDLSGYEVASLCGNCSGSRVLEWRGTGEDGRPLPLGPYILWLKRSGRPPLKKVVILAKPL